MSISRNRKEYYKNYYKKNKEQLKEYRNKKYAYDDDYRNRALSRAYLQRAVERLSHKRKKQTRIVNGKRECVYDSKTTAFAISRDIDTLEDWRSKGIIPESLFKSSGFDMYTASQIFYLRYITDKMDNGEIKLHEDQLARILKAVWKEVFSVKKIEGILEDEGAKIKTGTKT